MRIRSVRHRGLRRLIDEGDARGVAGDLRAKVRRVIVALSLASDAVSILGPPGWRIHRLRSDRAGTWIISVSGNWRITFREVDGEIVELDPEDYH